MAASAGSIGQFFPDIFGAGAPMSGAGAAATTSTAAAGAGAMGPLAGAMLGSAAIQGVSSVVGGVLGQQSAKDARNAAQENLVRGWGFDTWRDIKEKSDQMAALREGYSFMQSPIYQQKQNQDFRSNFMLSGKFDPYLTSMASRMRG